ncbi:Hypothetical_protein [Hexamita inflata]|uniref:Hypothetical_protein n=1 Tax=Hexamita inflata TaxID=28002 RepID=A0AA86NEX1_9EUKA|nr:Hypothetical protein HINF_LOCUS5696 [Hexamita inflata]CAI9923060.1 Hypothetical protein HINF_LOCUS10705 [Hexamita inflata]
MLKNQKQLSLSKSQLVPNKSRVSFSQISQTRTPKLINCKSSFLEPKFSPQLLSLNNDSGIQRLPLNCSQSFELTSANSYECEYQLDSARLGAELKKLNQSLGVNYNNELIQMIKNSIHGAQHVLTRVHELLVLCTSHCQSMDILKNKQAPILSQLYEI